MLLNSLPIDNLPVDRNQIIKDVVLSHLTMLQNLGYKKITQSDIQDIYKKLERYDICLTQEEIDFIGW